MAGGPLVPANAVGPYRVVDVVDGDTAKVRIGGLTTTLRLIGIDTPETKDPRRPVECFGREASAKASKLLAGQTVRLTYDSSQDRIDRYGRTLAYVWLSDGQSYGWQMLHDGFASEYTYDLPYRYQAQFRAEQADARDARRGLWAANTCNGDLNRAAATSSPPPTTSPQQPRSSQPIAAGCDPNYSPCVPLVGHDLDCSDVKGPITVIGADPNRFDADGDAVGCEG